MLMILDFKILSLWFVIEDRWYNTLTSENNWFLNVLVKSKFATPTPFGSVSCFVVGICLSNHNLIFFLIHHVSYSKEYQRYLMHRKNLGSIWKIGRYPIKVSEVLVGPIVGFCGCSMFCCSEPCVFILMGMRELIALVYVSFWCLMTIIVPWPILTVPWISL